MVDFAHRKTEGYIVEVKETSAYPIENIKPILSAKDDYSVITEQLMHLSQYMIEHYHLRYIDVLRLMLPSQMRGDRVVALTKRVAYIAVEGSLDKIVSSLNPRAKVQRDLVTFLYGKHIDTAIINNKFSSSALRALIDSGIVAIEQQRVMRTPNTVLQGSCDNVVLTPTQIHVVDSVLKGGDNYLLHGVTGSGKTEVYMHIISQVISHGKNAILLVPEISLTPNMLRLFRQRFGDCVAILHSGLSAGEKLDEWTRIRTGQCSIVVGARSAIFAPIDNIGIIIIDEEHDSSYVSDFNPRYNSLDIAKWRAKYNNCSVLLGSATPSLTSYYQAKTGVLKLLSMPERINKQPLPSVEVVDMALASRLGNKSLISPQLQQHIQDTLDKKQQIMLFLNRRGYSSYLMCTECGYIAKCEKCDVSLTVHNHDNQLKCHYCGNRYHMLTTCPECSSHSFRHGKIGTEQIESLIKKMFPQARVLRMDADTTAVKDGHAKILSAFGRGEADILLGTQMIAKGHDFGNVTLVGILDADQSLHHPDYISAERTFQLLTQVAGRSGRDVHKGKVVMQTYTPYHYCIQLATRQDYVAFYNKEINLREMSQFPPFSNIVRILYLGEDKQCVIDQLSMHYAELNKLAQAYPASFIYIDKMICPISRADNKHRLQILIKLQPSTTDDMLSNIYNVCDNMTNKKVSAYVELNPNSLN